jgi:hypothetical protein
MLPVLKCRPESYLEKPRVTGKVFSVSNLHALNSNSALHNYRP